jgi:cytochrome c-type biogenesis protein CcmH
MALVGVALLAALVAVLLLRPQPEASTAERARQIASGLRCPDCQGLSVADSPTAAAQEISRQVDAMVAAGATEQEVRDHFVARYGEWILLSPSTPAWWLIPFAAVLVGTAALGWWLLRGRGDRASAHRGAPLSEAERRRLHDEAEALDA